jgi:hypothetical protein
MEWRKSRKTSARIAGVLTEIRTNHFRNSSLLRYHYHCMEFNSGSGHVGLMLDEVAMPYLRRLITGFPLRRPGFEPGSGHVGFVVDKVAMPYLRRLIAGFPLRRPGFEPGSGHVGFVVDKVAVGQVFLGTSVSPTNSQSTDIHHHVLSRTGTIGQLVADVPSGLSLTPPQETKKKTMLDEVTMRQGFPLLSLVLSFYLTFQYCPIMIMASRGER